MKPSDFQKTIQCQFESKLKKVVKGIVKNYQKELKRRKKNEIPFCELPEIIVEKFTVWDDYETDYTIFNVCGNDIRVYDDELAEALKKLSDRNRENLLMYYFLEMNNEEKVVKGIVKNYQKELKRRKKNEIPFCELPEIIVEKFTVWDDYETDYTIFNVCGNDIRVYDDELAEALKKLSDRNRENLLMYYFLEMNNEEIARVQNISRSGVFQNRYNSLELMKKILKEEK